VIKTTNFMLEQKDITKFRAFLCLFLSSTSPLPTDISFVLRDRNISALLLSPKAGQTLYLNKNDPTKNRGSLVLNKITIKNVYKRFILIDRQSKTDSG